METIPERFGEDVAASVGDEDTGDSSVMNNR